MNGICLRAVFFRVDDCTRTSRAYYLGHSRKMDLPTEDRMYMVIHWELGLEIWRYYHNPDTMLHGPRKKYTKVMTCL